MLTISPGLLIPTQEQNTPMFCYHNLVTISNITATNAEASYPITNVANPATNLFWKASTNATNTIEIDVESFGDEIDYIAIAKHNFGSGLINVRVDTKNIANSVSTIVPAYQPADDTPLIIQFTPAIVKTIRLVLLPQTTIKPQAAVIYTGKAMRGQRKVYVGHTPITLGREARFTNGRSENANFLGRIILQETVSGGMKLMNLDPGWYRSTFDLFVKEAALYPFFFAWRPQTYPAEVGFVWLTSSPVPVNEKSNGMMSVDLQYSGVIA